LFGSCGLWLRGQIRSSSPVSSFHPLYALTGLLVGILVGLTGVGGGSLMTPLLVLLFGFHPATAVGTDLLCASVTKTVGTAVHDKQNTIDWPIVGALASGSLPAATATLIVMDRLGPMSPGAANATNVMLAIALMLTSVCIFFRPWLLGWAARHIGTTGQPNLKLRTTILGVALGVLVSITSVGAGALGTTALLILYPRVPVSRIAATDIAHAVPLTLVAGIGRWLMGSVDIGLMLGLLAGSVPGVILGSLLCGRTSDNVLRPVLAMTLLAVSVRMLAA
jgi:uncharacterized protein